MRQLLPPHFIHLSLTEGLAVGALILSRIRFVSAHQNAVQRAVVLTVAVVSTGLNGAFDALVCIVVHSFLLLLLDSHLVWLGRTERNVEKTPFSLHFDRPYAMITTITILPRRFSLWQKLPLRSFPPTL